MTPADRARLGDGPPPEDNGQSMFGKHMCRVGELSAEVGN